MRSTKFITTVFLFLTFFCIFLNAIDYVVENQAQFNALFVREDTNIYKIKDDCTSLTLKLLTGGYNAYGITSFLSNGDTWGLIRTNLCQNIIFDNGAFIIFGDTPGYLKIDTDNIYIQNSDIRGTGSVACALNYSYYLDAPKIKLIYPKTSNRRSYTNFTAFYSNLTDDNQLILNPYINNIEMEPTGIKQNYHQCLHVSIGTLTTSIGYKVLEANQTGPCNIGLGYLSLSSNVSGGYNNAFGNSTLSHNINGHENSAFGNDALRFNESGNNNCAFGVAALQCNKTGSFNSAFGQHALQSNTIGQPNDAFGYNCLEANINGVNNCAFGWYALTNNINGSYNTSMGHESLKYSSGSNNCAFGYHSLFNLNIGARNTAIGDSAGSSLTTGNNNLLLGFNAQPSNNTVNNEITLGDGNIKTLRCAVSTITTLSDKRDKTNIETININALEFIKKLNPVRFKWDKREFYENEIPDGSKKIDKWESGFIAQDLDETLKEFNAEWLGLVEKNNPDKLESTPGKLLPITIKAIQELSNEIKLLKRIIVLIVIIFICIIGTLFLFIYKINNWKKINQCK